MAEWLNIDAVAISLDLTPYGVLQLAMTDETFPMHSLHQNEICWTGHQIKEWVEAKTNPHPPIRAPEHDNKTFDLVADIDALDTTKVIVWRHEKNDDGIWRDTETLFILGPSEMSLTMLQDRILRDYGAGKYKLQVREKGRIRKSRIVDID